MLNQDQVKIIADEFNAGFTFAHLTPRGYVDAFVDVCEAGVCVFVSYDGEGRDRFCLDAAREAFAWLGSRHADIDGAQIEHEGDQTVAYLIWAVESDEEIARHIDSVRRTGRFEVAQ